MTCFIRLKKNYSIREVISFVNIFLLKVTFEFAKSKANLLLVLKEA